MKSTIILLTLAITILIIGSSIQAIQAAETTISVEPSTQELATAYVGETIKVDLKVNAVNNLWSWCISNLTFNTKVLNLTTVEEGPFLKSGGQTLFIWTSNSPMIQKGTVPEMSGTLLVNNSVSGSGVIATLTFKVVSTGTSQISLNTTRLLTPYEISSDINTVTGIYEEISSSSINGILSINQLTDPPESESDSIFSPLVAGVVVVMVIVVLAVMFFLRKRK